MDVKQLGMRIRLVRQAQGLEQKPLAVASGVHQTTISRVERGLIERPAINDLLALSHALGISLGELLEGEDGWSQPSDQQSMFGRLQSLLARHPDVARSLAQVSDAVTRDDIDFIRRAVELVRQKHS